MTWLFKSTITGFYYLTLPFAQTSRWYNTLTTWSRVRINSTLSNGLGNISLYIQGMGGVYQVPNFGVINSNTGPCTSTGNQYDATYAAVADGTTFTDFGYGGGCGWYNARVDVNMVGTPFGIRDGLKAFTGPGCSWNYGFTFSCPSIQQCIMNVNGNCGGGNFMGALSVINVTQFQSDINTSCALYPYDPPSLLSCKGTETVSYTCTPPPCTQCPPGQFSSAIGQSYCTPCPPGSFSTSYPPAMHAVSARAILQRNRAKLLHKVPPWHLQHCLRG
jgi:hypothetical protein